MINDKGHLHLNAELHAITLHWYFCCLIQMLLILFLFVSSTNCYWEVFLAKHSPDHINSGLEAIPRIFCKKAFMIYTSGSQPMESAQKLAVEGP